MPMQITLFGGSFNPPHLGHLIVTQQAFELIPQIDELWVLPAYRHTFQKELAPSEQRIQMCNLLNNELPEELRTKVRLETIEIDHKMSGETYETLQQLKTKYPNHSFSFLMGSDQLQSFTKWGNWEKLIEEMHFYVYPRSGFRNEKLFPNMSFLESATQVITNLSSTLVRKRLQDGQPTDNLLPKKIQEYIETHALYLNFKNI